MDGPDRLTGVFFDQLSKLLVVVEALESLVVGERAVVRDRGNRCRMACSSVAIVSWSTRCCNWSSRHLLAERRRARRRRRTTAVRSRAKSGGGPGRRRGLRPSGPGPPATGPDYKPFCSKLPASIRSREPAARAASLGLHGSFINADGPLVPAAPRPGPGPGC